MSNKFFNISFTRPLSESTAVLYRNRVAAVFRHLGVFLPSGEGLSVPALLDFLDQQPRYRDAYVTALSAYASPGASWVDALRKSRGRTSRTPPELQEFMAYLRTQGLSVATAASYAAAIQSVANKLDAPLTAPMPDSWAVLEYSPGLISRISAAVSHWTNFIAAADGEHDVAARAPTIAELMRHLAQRRVPASRLVELRWDDLQVTTKDARDGVEHWTEVRFAISRGPECWNHYDVSPAAPRGELVRLYRLDRHYADLLRVHRLWAAPQVPYDPVFPAHPGSSVPMTARTLRKFATGA